MQAAIERCNRGLDRLARPELRLFTHTVAPFRFCAASGLALASALSLSLASARGLSLAVVGALALCGIATFLALAMLTKLVTGEERLVYYHHELAILASSAVLLAALRLPRLPYLDLSLLGIGAFLACGRIGCLLVGCCHGRPCRFGIRYARAHEHLGFSPHYVGLRLFPIQLVESLWVAAIVVVGCIMVLHDAPPGAALTWYVVAYGAGRFVLEFGRGDAERPYFAGFSEGQWISVGSMGLVPIASSSSWIELRSLHVAATAAVALTMLVVAGLRRRPSSYGHRLWHPHHVAEVAGLVERLDRLARRQVEPGEGGGSSVRSDLFRTSAGYRVAALRGVPDRIVVASERRRMSFDEALALAALLHRSRGGAGSCELRTVEGCFELRFSRESAVPPIVD